MSSPRDHPADLVALVVLGTISLVPLWTSFAGLGWLVVGECGVLAAVLLVLAGRWARWPVWPVPLMWSLVVLVGCYPMVSRAHGIYRIVPDSGSTARVLRGIGQCWRELLDTLPRLDSVGTVLMVPWLLAMVFVFLAALAALHTHTVTLQLIPLAVMFTLALLLGRPGAAGSQAGIGVAFATVGIVWLDHRGRRREESRDLLGHRSRRQLLATVLTVCLAGSLAPLIASSVHAQDRVVWRESLARGLDTSSVETLLTGFRRYTRQPEQPVDNVAGRRLLKVTGLPVGTPIRFSVLDWYDGREWRPSPDPGATGSVNRFLKLSSTLDNPSAGRLVGARVQVLRNWRSAWVPTAGALQSFDFTESGEHDRRADITYNPATGAALLPSRLHRGDNYYFTARLPDDRLDPSMRPAATLSRELYDEAAFVDDIATAFLLVADGPMDALFRAAASLRKSGRYSDGATGFERRFQPGQSRRRLDQQFLHATEIVGNDEQYAAAMALIAVRMGIPARVVLGARASGGQGVVRGSQVHAWIEVQVADGSWRMLPTSSFMGHRPPTTRKPPKRRPGASILQPPAPPRLTREQVAKVKPQLHDPAPQAPAEPGSPWRWWWAAFGLVLVPPLWKAVRRLRRRRRTRPSTRLAGGWEEFVDAARDVGFTVPRATRPGQAALIGPGWVELASRADAAIFAAVELEDPEVAAYWHDIRRARRGLHRQVPWWRRAAAPFNPVTLIRRH